MEETLPGHVLVTASAMASLGRRLPISIDTNLVPPTSTQTITYHVVDPTGSGADQGHADHGSLLCLLASGQPPPTGYAGRLNPDYQQITQIESRANSTYEAGMFKVERYGRRGLSLHAHYIYAPRDGLESQRKRAGGRQRCAGPGQFSLEYGASNLDIRHSFGGTAIYETPWKLRGRRGKLGQRLDAFRGLQARSGLPYTMRTSGSLAGGV